ncbi:pyridoxal-phosphate dependent enzyme [Ketobacter sp. MCCC 1A13808]|uniref:1-aminocyclopropane-1-carboxylate deaminase/D-cysteine desulfhydrase n=1 Tax=Ketobacter sp. MCCC 1A13808 TaxID=2602738 RepID=UPI000F24AE19|nr:pyridoxal-phosphate dependent enzyme [Ketobacter sp. MCCC 1A13808]MVF14407.1 pyridoxal-phosphate dependent enzyme [Ketobacter sp. MCCC 1A13808]RLP52230.1 MAG: pyridoxal-phosphate dependent enzyme [Ketobacter sp.]
MCSAEMTFQSLIHQYEDQLAQSPVLAQSGLLKPLIVEPLKIKQLSFRRVQLSVLRADLLHPKISGNKWFKLKYNLLTALNSQDRTVVSFGGAWSNHLHALAYAGRLLGLNTTGIVRGEELSPDSNAMLKEIQQQGMQLNFISRADYRNQCRVRGPLSCSSDALAPTCSGYIPEGGDNVYGMLGASTMLDADQLNALAISHVVTGVGTGCTFAGLRLSAPGHITLLGISALKGSWVEDSMSNRLQAHPNWFNKSQLQNWQINSDYHRGGFGRVDESLLSFITEFEDNTGLQLDPLYTGKAMMALLDLVNHGAIPPGSHVLFVHSGGLQGKRGFEPINEYGVPNGTLNFTK